MAVVRHAQFIDMEITSNKSSFTTIAALQASDIFAEVRRPSIRTLREWTRRRLIPHFKVGHFVYYDLPDVAACLRTKMRVEPVERPAAEGWLGKNVAVTPTASKEPGADKRMAMPRWTYRKHKGFKIVNFKNRNGAITLRVCGRLHGVRIRRNFKRREDAAAEVRRLETQQRATANEFHTTITRLSEEQLREAEIVFHQLNGKPHGLTFYADLALARCREIERNVSLADAVRDYVAARTKDHERTLISWSQLRTLKIQMEALCAWFPKAGVLQLTPAVLIPFMERGGVSLKCYNNRRGIISTFFKFARRNSWIDVNPIKKTPRYRLAHRRGSATTISADHAANLMHFLEDYEGGALVPYFALCLFAGVRPCFREGEMSRLKSESVNLDTGVVHIEPDVSKVRMKRIITIQPNLAAWLRAYPISQHTLRPTGMLRMHHFVFQKFGLTQDVLRHTFISMYVGKYRSIAEAALQAGNSEEIIRRHYLDLKSRTEAARFFAIAPRSPAALAAADDEIAIASPS